MFKSKRKRVPLYWWILRRALMTTILIVVAAGFWLSRPPKNIVIEAPLPTAQPPSIQTIVYLKNGNLWRVTTSPIVQAELIADLDADIWYLSYVDEGRSISDPTKDAFLRISFDGENVEIIVEDQGEGFKLDELADPTQAENLLKPCGRGILIIRSFMDEVKLSPKEGGGTRLRMLKKLPEVTA
jgi:hypothetical protein